MRIFFTLLSFILFPQLLFGQDNQIIDNIRDTYNQKAPFQSFSIDLSRTIGGRGEKESTLNFEFLDCHSLDCSEYGLDEIVRGMVLRKVITKSYIDLDQMYAEYLFNNEEEVIFNYSKISSPSYYEKTDRECAEERYYYYRGSLIRILIKPCPVDQGEYFEPITKDNEFTPEEIKLAKTLRLKGTKYQSLFHQLVVVESLDSR